MAQITQLPFFTSRMGKDKQDVVDARLRVNGVRAARESATNRKGDFRQRRGQRGGRCVSFVARL